jgi:hypothetical protein
MKKKSPVIHLHLRLPSSITRRERPLLILKKDDVLVAPAFLFRKLAMAGVPWA